ncbi:DUF58 domain-containing protein [Sandaracinobacter neustonicus]|uniref:DUF58 domain-containing protein n=1 Tax=Sandaracinobacter neustonicus TaxID=1715348 RepID=UPI001F3731BD|nr:DUF58 domain-containing protein [Sandaracinobacter neustonicus]
MALLALCDWAWAPAQSQLALALDHPPGVDVGAPLRLGVTARFDRNPPRAIELSTDRDPLLEQSGGRARADFTGDEAAATFDMRASGRGTALLRQLWSRWHGPLGLMWRQRRDDVEAGIAILPDMAPTRREAAAAMSAQHFGQRRQNRRGEGGEYEALTEFRAGMSRRAIDWKHSARATRLVAREYRIERNQQLLLVIDSGRAMSEPMDGVARVDRAVAAAMQIAYAALRDGDQVGFHAFDSRPRVQLPPVSGPRAFTAIRHAAASVACSDREANHVFGLTSIAGKLGQRATLLIFTEFTDMAAAELMLGAVTPLLRKHLLLFVLQKDAELEAVAARPPHEIDDISRAVAAGALLDERRLVIARLRRMGAEVVEAPAGEAGTRAIERYLQLKQRGRV